jgi:hypothetical protein
MQIWVKDAFDKSLIGSSREELAEDLAHTATKNYGADVLAWFDGDHSEPLTMASPDGPEVWTVID